MFRRKSPVHNKQQKRRRLIDPRKRMLIGQILIGLTLFFAVALLIATIWYGTRVESLTIATIEISGGETISHEVVEQRVKQELEGFYLGIIPRRFAWFYPQNDVLTAVRSVERVKDPVVDRVSGTKLSVTFDEYVPYALWCKEGTEECLLVDKHGYAFAPAPRLSGGALMRYVTLGRIPEIGTTVVSSEELINMNAFVDEVMQSTSFTIQSVEIDAVRDVFFKVSGGGEFRATLTMPAAEAVANLRAVLSAPEFADIAPGSFQYIDLRFGSKVFVNDSLEEVATTSDEVVDGSEEADTNQ